MPPLTIVALLSLGLYSSFPTKANTTRFPDITFARPDRPSGSGTPGNREDAASRTMSCPEPTLLTIVPEDVMAEEISAGVFITTDKSVWGSTVYKTPRLWLSLDQPVDNATIKVTIEDSTGKIFYTEETPFLAGQGVFYITLQEGSLAELNELYKWRINLQTGCEEGEETYALAVNGWIERVDEPEGVAIAQTPEAIAAAYAEAGIWFDAVDATAQMYRSDPDNTWAASAWNTLMEAGDLDIPATQLTDAEPAFEMAP